MADTGHHAQTRIGRCSICGGDVMAHVGPWWAVTPPPPPYCTRCGATGRGGDEVIPMEYPHTVAVRSEDT